MASAATVALNDALDCNTSIIARWEETNTSVTDKNTGTCHILFYNITLRLKIKKVENENPKFETVRRLENVLVKFNFLSHPSTPNKKTRFLTNNCSFLMISMVNYHHYGD